MENTALNGTTNATKDQEDWKKKKGYRPILVAVSLALLLSLYAGGYLGSGTHLRHGEMGTTNVSASSSSTSLVVGETNGDSIPIGFPCDYKCVAADNNCAIPSGLDHGVCLGWYDSTYGTMEIYCQNGQPYALCSDNSDCVKPMGLEHGVCYDDGYGWFCQDGKSGSHCYDTSDCVVPKGLDHAVCRGGKCQSGQAGARCGQTSDCLPIAGLSPPHAVCRKDKCQHGVKGDYCGQDSDCLRNECGFWGRCEMS